jgi:hypothetical protein
MLLGAVLMKKALCWAFGHRFAYPAGWSGDKKLRAEADGLWTIKTCERCGEGEGDRLAKVLGDSEMGQVFALVSLLNEAKSEMPND